MVEQIGALALGLLDQAFWLSVGVVSGVAPFYIFGSCADRLRPPVRSDQSYMLWVGFTIFTIPSACIVSGGTALWCRAMKVPFLRRWSICTATNVAFATLISVPMAMICLRIAWEDYLLRRPVIMHANSQHA